MLDSTAKTNKIKIYDIFITDLHELDISLHTPLPRAGADPASINVAILLKIKEKNRFHLNEWIVMIGFIFYISLTALLFDKCPMAVSTT